MICISSNKGNSTIVYYEHNGKISRTKKVMSKYYSEKGNIKVDWQ